MRKSNEVFLRLIVSYFLGIIILMAKNVKYKHVFLSEDPAKVIQILIKSLKL